MGEARRKAHDKKAQQATLIEPAPFSLEPTEGGEASTLMDAVNSYVITTRKLRALGRRPCILRMAGGDPLQSMDQEYGAWTKEYGPDLTVAFIPTKGDDTVLRIFAYFNLGREPGTCDQRRFIVEIDQTTGGVQAFRMTDASAMKIFEHTWQDRIRNVEPEHSKRNRPLHLIHVTARVAEGYAKGSPTK